MTLLDRNQFNQEQHIWKEKLERFKQENVLLKYQLSELVDNNEDNNYLQLAEYFQNELLIMDDKLKNLFFRLEEFSRFLRRPKKEGELPGKEIADYNNLKKDIAKFEKKFLKLTDEFKGKMSENQGY